MSAPSNRKRLAVFGAVWIGQLLSLVGSSLTLFALGVWIYKSTGSALEFGVILLCSTLPGIVISPLAGALVDRLSRRLVMLVCDSSGALTTVTIWWLFSTGQIETWHIYLSTAIQSTLAAFQWPAYIASVTLLVPKHHLGRASGMTQMGRALAQLVAPLLGASLLLLIGLEGVILIDLGTFAIAALTLLAVRFPAPRLLQDTAQQARSLLQELRDGWSYVVSRPGIFGLMVFFAASNFLGGTLELLVTPLVLSFASTVALGTIMSTGGVGMLAGSIVMSVWGGPRRRVRAIFGFMIACGVFAAVAGVLASVPLVAAAAFGFFFSVPIINGCSQAVLQTKVPPHLQGRVFALEGALGSASLPLAYLVSGTLADRVFEPLMADGGPLADTVGRWIGSGPGRGIGLMFVTIGLLTVLSTLVATRFHRLRRVEDELPDVDADHNPRPPGANLRVPSPALEG